MEQFTLPPANEILRRCRRFKQDSELEPLYQSLTRNVHRKTNVVGLITDCALAWYDFRRQQHPILASTLAWLKAAFADLIRVLISDQSDQVKQELQQCFNELREQAEVGSIWWWAK